MIEILALVGFLAVDIFTRKAVKDPLLAATILNATISACISFIVCVRAVLKITMEKIWRAEKRCLWLCLLYFLLLFVTALGVLFFGEQLLRFPVIQLTVRFTIYAVLIFMFVFVNIMNLKDWKFYGKVYLCLEILDSVLLISLFCCDFTIGPELLIKDRSILLFLGLVLIVLAIVNNSVLYFRPYWLHKVSLMKLLQMKIKRGQENKLIEPPERNLKKDQVYKEITFCLDLAPNRVFEMNFIVAQVRSMLCKAGKSYKEATELCADFSSVLIKNLMKRKYDFSFLPNFVVKGLQKQDKRFDGKNRRGIFE